MIWTEYLFLNVLTMQSLAHQIADCRAGDTTITSEHVIVHLNGARSMFYVLTM